MKTEFRKIVSELSEALSNKEEKLRSSENFNAYTQGKINNVNGRIVGLEISGNDIVKNYSENPEIENQFQDKSQRN